MTAPTSAPSIRAVLFDKDGTLVDFHATWAPATEAGLRAATTDEAGLQAAAEAIGYDLERRAFVADSAFIAGSNDEITDLLEAHLDMAAFERACMEAAKQTTTPADGLPQLLEALRGAGIALAVVTNDWARIADEQLAQLGWSHLFDTVVGSDSGFGAKPEPGMVLGALERLGVAPEAAAMVGDTAHDLHAGRAAGVLTVLVTGSGATETVDPSFAELADIVVDSLSELWDQLERRDLL